MNSLTDSAKEKMKIVGAYTDFGPLKKVVVGCFHPENYFEIMPESRFKNRIMKITRESVEDLDNLKKTLRNFGVEVYELKNFFKRPEVYSNGHISVINPRPPLSPRDNLLFVDDKMFSLFTGFQPQRFFDDFAHHDLLAKFAKQGAEWHQMPKGYYDIDTEKRIESQQIGGEPLGENTPYLDGSNFTMCGNKIFYTVEDTANNLGIKWFKNIIGDKIQLREYKNKKLFRNHIDSYVKILRPGLVLSEFDKATLLEEIPEMHNWEVIHLPIQKNLAKSKLHTYMEQTGIGFDIENWSAKWLNDWTDDDVLNTNFDINVLSINENTVLIPNENVEFQKVLKKHKVETVVCKLRHRLFWGNGLHCLTSDILREDECIDYFE